MCVHKVCTLLSKYVCIVYAFYNVKLFFKIVLTFYWKHKLKYILENMFNLHGIPFIYFIRGGVSEDVLERESSDNACTNFCGRL